MTDTLSPMTSRRRTEIRDLLVDHVARDTARARDAAPGAGTRRPVSSTPRSRARSRPLVAGALVATAVGVLVYVDVQNPTPSYASWQATPATAPGGAVTDDKMQQWASQCTDLGVGGIGIQGLPPREAGSAQREVLVDRRGEFTFCVDVAIGSGTAQDPLIALAGIRADVGPEADDSLNTMWGTVHDEPFTKPRGADVLLLGGDVTDPPPPPSDDTAASLTAYQVYGLAGPDVDAVDVVLSSGTVVTATVSDGLWGAWWPADEGAASGSRLVVVSGTGAAVVTPAEVALP